MATIVGLTKEKKQIAADHFTVVEIVDGQQRLTTIIILLKAIQRKLDQNSKVEKKVSDDLEELLVKGDDLNLLLLQTNHDSSHIFSDYLRNGAVPSTEASTSADQNVSDAIHESEAFVERWKNESGSLVDLTAIVRNRLWAIYHDVEDEGLVYRVFEVLNSRGLDVSWIDKLKSQLMGLAFETGPTAGREQAIKELHNIWRDIYRTIGKQKYLTSETVRFAGTLYAQTSPSRPLSEAASVQRLVEVAGKKSKKIVDVARWLLSIVVAEDRLLSNYRWRAVTQILQARLVALAILLRAFPAGDERVLLGRWERITFRIYGLAGLDARSYVKDYTSLAWSIVNDELPRDAIMRRLSDIGEKCPISKVIEDFDPSNCYEGWTEQLRYVFYRYDEHLSSEAGERVNELQWRKIWSEEPAKSVEHIKPQSSGVSYMHHLGNLMMLPPGVNSKLKDKDPTEKAATYRTSGLLSAIDVANRIKKGRWEKTAVEKRAVEILEWAATAWND